MTQTDNHICDWDYIENNWDDLIKNSRKTIIRSLRVGIPIKHRRVVWGLLANKSRAIETAGFKYENIEKKESNSSRIIQADVPRTFPNWCIDTTPEFLDSLSNILNAYANIDSQLGYTQGMNFIAAMFLIHMPEEEAFWCFYSFMHLSQLPHRLFFLEKFPKLKIIKHIVDKELKERFPEISESLKDRGLDSTIFLPQWFMVCFLSGGFDFDMSSFLFEQFLAFGVAPLLSFGLAIIYIHRDYFKEQGFERMLQVLTNPGHSKMMNDRQKINVAWAKMWVSTSEFEEMLTQIEQDNGGKFPI